MALNFFPRYFTNLFRPRKEGASWFYLHSSTGNTFDKVDYLKAFEELPEINAVISAKANYFSNGRFIVVNDKLEEQEKNPINILLKNPNWFQAGKEFLINTKLFHEIFGNEFIYTLTPFGFNADRVKALYTLPPNLVEPRYKNQTPFFMHASQPEGVIYEYKREHKTEEIPGEYIIHLNDNRVCFSSMRDENMLRGESKLRSLNSVINNLRAAYESRGVILRSRGATGILSPGGKDITGPIPFDPSEIEDLQNKFKRQYGTLNNQSQLVISNKPTQWSQMGVNEPEKLGLFKETEEGFLKILDTFGMHPDVFATIKGATHENQKQAEKGVYIRTIIPDANEWCFALNKKFFPDGKLKIIADYSHLPIFQEDKKTKHEAITIKVNYLSKLLQDGQITDDEYRSELLEFEIGDGKAIVKESEQVDEVEDEQSVEDNIENETETDND